MADSRAFVPDTNVIFKWYIAERERNLAQARAVREDFVGGNIDLTAPNILSYELANIMRVAFEEGRLPYAEAIQTYTDFEALQIPLVDADAWVPEALVLALGHRISVFDALFLLVGARSNATVVTDDERLVRAGQAAGFRIIRLADYSSVSG